MATMQEEMAKVDYAECNDWEKNFYDSQKDGTYTPSPKQMGIINKMPKLANGSTPPQADTSFNHGANKPVEKLSQFDWYNKLPPDAQQKHATTIFLSMRK